MRPFKALISFADAQNIAMGSVTPVEEKEDVGIEESGNRVLAQDIKAKIDVPSFDRAAMDGYAVIAEDTFGADQFNPRSFACPNRQSFSLCFFYCLLLWFSSVNNYDAGKLF